MKWVPIVFSLANKMVELDLLQSLHSFVPQTNNYYHSMLSVFREPLNLDPCHFRGGLGKVCGNDKSIHLDIIIIIRM